MYADDTLIISKDDDIDEVTRKCSEGLNKVATWYEANKLSMNYNKTKFMVLKHKKNTVVPNIHVRHKLIGQVHTYEYLGVLIDESLKFNEYVDSIWKKANNKIGILSRIRRFISVKTAVQIYKCMIRPHLDYIDYVIDSSTCERIEKLDKLQNKAIRRIEYCTIIENRKSIDDLCLEYNIEKLPVRRKRNLIKIMYKESKDTNNINYRRPQMELRSKSR